MLTACISTGPTNNKEFASIGKISDLNGTYLNKGDDGSEGKYEHYLSNILWPNDKSIDHTLIDTIVVSSVSDTQLSVKGLHDNSIVKEQIFIDGKDFKIQSGRIHLSNNFDGAFNLVMGISNRTIDLGIDASGHGKLRREENAVGMALIPFVINEKKDVRFLKVEE